MSFSLSSEDKEETAQWVSAPGVIKSILQSIVGRVSTLKGQSCLVHHKTLYDGILEKATLIAYSFYSD